MVEILLKLVEQLNSSVFVLLGLLFLAFLAVYKIACMITKFTTFENNNEKTSNTLDSIKDNVAKTNATVDLLYQAHLATLQTKSPVNLSELGKEISNDLLLEEKVNSHWEQIKSKIMQNTSNNPYDIQTSALKVAQDCYDQFFTFEEKEEVKLYAFNKGTDLMQIYPIIGVIARDRILKEMNIELDKK